MGVVAGSGGDGGVADGEVLSGFAAAVHAGTVDDAGRAAVVEAVGEAGLVDAAAVCANFNMMVRIADGTGTPIDAGSMPVSEELRRELGLDQLTSRRLPAEPA